MKMDKQELAAALDAAIPGVAADGTVVEQGASFLFLGDRICTCDGNVSVSVPFETGMTGGVKATPLARLLKKLPDGPVDVTMAGGEFRVKAFGVRAVVVAEADVRLDVAAVVGLPAGWTPLPDGFLDALRLCAFSVGRDSSDAALSSLHVTAASVESTDDMRATRVTFASPWDCADGGLLVPGWAFTVLSGRDPVEVGETEGWLHFRDAKGTSVACRRPSANYPELDGIFAVEGMRFVFPEGMRAALARAGIFATAELNEDARIRVDVGADGHMTVSGEGNDGWLKERLPMAKPARKSFSFEVHPALLDAVLDKLKFAIIGDGKLKFVERDGSFEHVISLFGDE